MGVLAWSGLGFHLAVVVAEKLVTALTAMNTITNCGRQGSVNDQQPDFREATSSPLANLQSAWFGGRGSASCIACPSLTARQR
jgi:hypothetical protein